MGYKLVATVMPIIITMANPEAIASRPDEQSKEKYRPMSGLISWFSTICKRTLENQHWMDITSLMIYKIKIINNSYLMEMMTNSAPFGMRIIVTGFL